MLGFGKPKVLEDVESKYSGKLQVKEGFGYKYVTTGILTQSGGIIKDVWQPILKIVASKNKSWLILGLATGTVAQLIAKNYQPTRIVGVEIDSEMIRLGRQYFNLDKIKNLEIKNQDAKQYVSGASENFDFILVDMYLGELLPDFVYSEKFLKKLGTLGKIAIFNHLFYEEWMKKNAESLVSKMKKVWPQIRLHRVLTNIMIIASKEV